MYRKQKLVISLLLLLIVVALLATGSSLLTISLSDNHNIPLGNLITWVGIISLPASIYFGREAMRNPNDKLDVLAAKVLKGLIIIAILWLPTCFLLAGNMSFTFSNKPQFQGGQEAMRIFWYLNTFLVAAPLLLLIFHWIFSYFRSPKK